MAKEIERKFLLAKGASIPIPTEHEKYTIKQAYLLAEKDKQIRVRIVNNFKAWITVKYTGSIVRDEFEYLIPLKDAKEMYAKSKLKVEKKRLAFKSKGHYDIDTFPNGLVTVEVEFKSVAQMKKWTKPNWLGEEITGNKKYSNITLAKKNLKF